MRAWSRPLDWAHDVDHGYGWLLLPWRGGWLAWKRADDGRSSMVVRGGEYVHEPKPAAIRVFRRFHNCTATGVY